jgi:hypothetical protein
MSNEEEARLGISVVYLKSMRSNISLPPNSVYTLLIDYPVESSVGFPVNSGKNGMDTINLLSLIGDAYEKIYASPNYFGVWGHAIGSLVLESVYVNHDKKLITLEVGS